MSLDVFALFVLIGVPAAAVAASLAYKLGIRATTRHYQADPCRVAHAWSSWRVSKSGDAVQVRHCKREACNFHELKVL